MIKQRWSLFLLLLLCTACGSVKAAPLPYVDLTRRSPLPAVADTKIVPLRIAVAAIISPQGTTESYTELANYLAKTLARPVQLIQRRTYAEVNALVAANAVDLAFVCTNAYVEGQAQFGMELLVAPQIQGKAIYYSELIVPATSADQAMADLQGKVFAFTDPMSFSGRVYPTYLVQQLGAAPETFFQRTFFTYSHDRAIEAVAAGVADGAAVDSLVLAYALLRDPTLHTQIRVIHHSPPFGIPPVVTSPELPPRQKRQLQDVLLSMEQNQAGRVILAHLGIDRFQPIADEAYTSVRQLVQQIDQTP